MNFVRIVRSGSIGTLEVKINETLENNIKSKFVDIKYSSSYNENAVVHTAIIIFERVI